MIVFHSVDLDGYLSAALVRKYAPGTWTQYDLLYADYNRYDEALERIRKYKPKTLYVVDFSFPNDVFDEIVDTCETVYWFDHHQRKIDTASEKMKALPGVRFSGVSAARLVFNHMCDQVKVTDAQRRFVELASDYDTYSFNQSNIRNEDAPAINSYIMFDTSKPIKMVDRVTVLYDTLAASDANDILDSWINKGRAYLNEQLNRGVRAASRAMFGERDGNRYAIVNAADNSPGFILESLLKEVSFGICWYMLSSGKIKCELRSGENSTFDVSKLAAEFGGGGHFHAAGCQMTLEQLQELLHDCHTK
jgi:uncharacterized protein